MTERNPDVLWTEGEYDVFECSNCQGSEGYEDEAEGWIDCYWCEGTGVYRKKRTGPQEEV
jgi:hypothetical protein